MSQVYIIPGNQAELNLVYVQFVVWNKMWRLNQALRWLPTVFLQLENLRFKAAFQLRVFHIRAYTHVKV
jgi:hypothetical protein